MRYFTYVGDFNLRTKSKMNWLAEEIENCNLRWYERFAIHSNKTSNCYTSFSCCSHKEYQLADNLRKKCIIFRILGCNIFLSDVCTKLLVKTRPSRPPIPHERKLLVAAAQKWKCANPFGTCLLYKVGEGYFDESLFEADHIDPYSKSFRSVANIARLCPMCHNIKSRMERLQALEEETDADVA